MLSIVVPTLNEENYLKRLLNDLMDQTYSKFEVIVSDARSDDRTVDIAESFGCEVVSSKRNGPGHGRNVGARKAKGDIFLFLDADVWIDNEEFLQVLLDEKQRKGLGLATCLYEFDNGNNFLSIISKLFMRHGVKKLSNVIEMCPGFCMLVDRKIHEEIDGFDEEIKIGEDFDYAKRVSDISRFGVVDKAKLSVSGRRFRTEGKVNLYFTYLYTTLYQILNGRIKKEVKDYRFGEY